MLKVDRSDVLGKTVFEIYQRKDAERIDTADNEALAGAFGGYSNDYELEMPDGQTRVIATNRIVSAMPLARQDTLLSLLTTSPSGKDRSSALPSWRITTC